jgi:hypothetical protein
MTFRLFENGFSPGMLLWLGTVLVGTGIAGLFGQLPGVEPKPYIIRFTEDRPNPLYRRICYTLAWSEAVSCNSLASSRGRPRLGRCRCRGRKSVVHRGMENHRAGSSQAPTPIPLSRSPPTPLSARTR